MSTHLGFRGPRWLRNMIRRRYLMWRMGRGDWQHNHLRPVFLECDHCEENGEVIFGGRVYCSPECAMRDRR